MPFVKILAKHVPKKLRAVTEAGVLMTQNFVRLDANLKTPFNEKSCYPKPPCRNFEDDFSNNRLVSAEDFDGNPKSADWTSDFTPNNARYEDGKLVMDLKYDKTKPNKEGNFQGFGATVSTTFYMLYGTVTARIKTASTSKGVVTSMVISNNTVETIGDEIDYEWVGLDPTEVQSNFYYNGTLDYTKGAHHKVGIDTTTEYRDYGIEWLPDALTWIVDGERVRTVTKESTWDAEANVYRYPSVDSRISFSIWDGGMGPEGTADWAGSPTDWSDENKVYSMYVDSVTVKCVTPGPDNYDWPPEGYGPPPSKVVDDKKGGEGEKEEASKTDPKQKQKSYTTLGDNQPLKTGSADDPDIIGAGAVPDYNGSQVKKLAIPIGVVSGLVLGSAAVFFIWRICFKPPKEVSPNGKI